MPPPAPPGPRTHRGHLSTCPPDTPAASCRCSGPPPIAPAPCRSTWAGGYRGSCRRGAARPGWRGERALPLHRQRRLQGEAAADAGQGPREQAGPMEPPTSRRFRDRVRNLGIGAPTSWIFRGPFRDKQRSAMKQEEGAAWRLHTPSEKACLLGEARGVGTPGCSFLSS